MDVEVVGARGTLVVIGCGGAKSRRVFRLGSIPARKQ